MKSKLAFLTFFWLHTVSQLFQN